jgi:hypothetical protein
VLGYYFMKEQTPGKKPSGSWKNRLTSIAAGGTAGTFFGGITYATARLLTDNEHAIYWGVGVGGSLASAGTGATLAAHSLGEAQDHRESGNKGKSRLKVAQATIEAAFGFGAAGGIAGFESTGVSGAIAGAVAGAALAGGSTLLQYRERTRKFPELIIPAGSSIQRDRRFPERAAGHEFPPVFRVTSLKDLKEFREINKELLTREAFEVPKHSNTPTHSSARGMRFLSAIMIVPDLQHYPIADPKDRRTNLGGVSLVEKNTDMTLTDSTDSIVVHPCKDSLWFWPEPTLFEDKVGTSRYLNEDKWGYWMDKSWKHSALVLVQYQGPGSFIGDKPNPHEVVDNYWLIDLDTRQDGIRRKVRQPQPVMDSAFDPRPAA